ncbi:MAG: hypothetical protein ACLRRT_15710 [Ruthenibacterium lactatiformans]
MKNTLYGIGLDIGVASVGWAVVGLNGTGEPVGLHRLGVRIFDKAEQPKTGESLAAPRRMARDAPPSAPQGAAPCGRLRPAGTQRPFHPGSARANV